MAKLKQKINSEAGFTLVELVAVSVLLGMFTLVLFGSLDGIISSRSNILNRNQGSRTARIAFERITRELNNKYLRGGGLSEANSPSGEDENIPQDPNAQDPNAQDPNIQSTNQSTNQRSSGGSSYFIGKNKSSGDAQQDSIRFLSSGVSETIFNGFSNHGVVEVGYELVPDSDVKYDGSTKNTFILTRNEQPAAVENEKIIESKLLTTPIASNISSLNFRYLNEDGAWVDDWDKNKSLIPKAIEIFIAIQNDDEDAMETSFKTAVFISQKANIPNSGGSQPNQPTQ